MAEWDGFSLPPPNPQHMILPGGWLGWSGQSTLLEDTMSEPSLLQSLKERKIVQWALANLAGAQLNRRLYGLPGSSVEVGVLSFATR